MFAALRTRFGIPGVISVIALVFAMLGGAYAANSDNGGKATASAKGPRGPRGKPGKPGPAGPQGPAGTQGAAGAKGDTGANGSNGKDGANGSPGAAGKSVVLVNEAPPGCAEGGFTYKIEGSANENEVCNGEEGPQGVPGQTGFTSTLPSGKTETGAYATGLSPETEVEGVKNSGGFGLAAVTFAIPLAASLDSEHVHKESDSNFTDFDEGGSETIGCSGSALAPTAPAGHLCVYSGVGGPPLLIQEASASNPGAATAGASLLFFGGFPGGAVRGTYAVTAP